MEYEDLRPTGLPIVEIDRKKKGTKKREKKKGRIKKEELSGQSIMKGVTERSQPVLTCLLFSPFAVRERLVT